MLNFILYNPIFEIILGILFFINMLATISLDYKQFDKNTQKINSNANNIIYRIKISIILAILSIEIALIVIFFSEYLLTAILIFTMFMSLINSITSIYKNDNNFTLDNKYYNTFSCIIFMMFFASYSIPIYMSIFQYATHFIKEIILLFFLNLKLILFVFLLLINISVFLSNITEILTSKQKFLIKKILTFNFKYYKLIQYNFFIYKKKQSRKSLIIDSIIYTILAPITIVLNILFIIVFKIIISVLSIINYFINKFYEYKNKRNLVTKKITYISIIISLFLSYIIVITNNNLFIDTTKDLFTYISTVILIPLIYDSIKNN